ncbi:MAG TPA: GNAT family N-acetyltransferase [Alphaproteobacteria bacterium]|nr:GNAT family N-acetyltransferase [Alphaproteobacteria bacterium]
MKPVFSRTSNITIREIGPDDWQAYKAYYKSLSNPRHFSGYLQDKDIDAPETGTQFFEDAFREKNFVLFGLFDEDRMIGQTSITFLEDEKGKFALLAGSEITDAYRGQRLVDIFYQRRMNYLKDMGYDGRIIMTIHPDNTNSQKAAARNGFIKTGEQDRFGYDVLMPQV